MSRRGANPAADRAAKNQQTIKGLLKLEGNKSCADYPRWASWNLGIFVCIRCSGIHRGMGTHISRVKSVDLDAWTDEQLQSVMKWGNTRANKYWEAKLSQGHVPSEAKIENFIRTKYESKRWTMEGSIPDPLSLSGDGDDDVKQPLNVVQEKAKLDRTSSQRQSSTSSQPPPPAARPTQNFDLIGGDDLSPPARPNTTDNVQARPPPQAKPQPAPSQLLGGLDFFGGPPDRPASASAQLSSGFAAPSRPDLKQSILSLYSSAPKPQAQAPQHTRQPSFGGMQSPPVQPTNAFGGLDDAFKGLNFSSSVSTPTQQAPKPSPFGQFGQSPSSKATAAPPLASGNSFGGGGGGFFDSGPKPPPKTNAKPAQPSLGTRQTNNSLGDFGAMLSPNSGPGLSSNSNGLLDFTSSPSPPASKPAMTPTPSTAPSRPPPQSTSSDLGSIFNLTSPQPTPQTHPQAQASKASAPASQSSFSANFDPWGNDNAWATPEPSAPVPSSSSSKLSNPTTTTSSSFAANDFSGFGDFSSSSSIKPSSSTSGGFSTTNNTTSFSSTFNSRPDPSSSSSGFSRPAPPQQPSMSLNDDFGGWGSAEPTSGQSGASHTQPAIAADEDFGGWNSAAPETPATPQVGGGAGFGEFGGGSGAMSPSLGRQGQQQFQQQQQTTQQSQQSQQQGKSGGGGGFGGGEDLFGNVWG
ncbi:hypothetical protein MMC25_005969 [Agyrium rufum]|nr:hypothetical protein [Agyrium rufum]